jgi:glycosyltransferase involved in cell wall biosynthesis
MMRADVKSRSYRLLAAALARLAGRPWQLLAVGDGAARDEVAAAFAPLGGRVRFAGRQDEPALPALYAAADLYAWPSLGEAYGMATLEAQAAGLPAVAGDEGGVSAIVAHGETGLLTPPGEVGAFAAALAALLDAPDRRTAMGAAALAKVARMHDVPAAAATLDRVLRAVTAARAPARAMAGRR